MIGDSGPYASVGMKVLERAAGHASGPYHLPSIDVEAFAVRTNNSGGTLFPGLDGVGREIVEREVIDDFGPLD